MDILEACAQFAGAAFVSGVWQGALLAAAVGLCLRLVPRATASLRFTLWTGVLIVVALLPWVESGASRHATISLHAPLLLVDERWSLGLAAVWATFSLLRACSLIVHGVHLWRLHREAEPVAVPGQIHRLLQACDRTVELRTSNQLDRPGVIGFFRPCILIPGWLYPQLTMPELEQIVLHELEHLRRGDDWLNLFQKLSLVLFPLNPVLIGIERLLCRERELACDDGVLRRTGEPCVYASCLATLAERGLDHRGLSLALGALERRSELSRRVHRILRGRVVLPPVQARLLTAVVCLVLLGGAAELARCPQLVSFAASGQRVAVAARPGPLPFHPGQGFFYGDGDAQTSSATLEKVALAGYPARYHIVGAKKKHRAVRGMTSGLGVPEDQPAASTGITLMRTSSFEVDSPRLSTLGEELTVTGTFAALRVDGGWLLIRL